MDGVAGEKSVRFSGEIDERVFDKSSELEEEEEGNYGIEQAGQGLTQELSRTSVRAAELDDDVDMRAFENLQASGGGINNTILTKRASDLARHLARAWEVKPEEVLIGDFLGNGAYGQVYKGKWSGTEVAVKIVQEDLVYQNNYLQTQEDISDAMKVFWAEVKLMRTLSHPNVVQFLGACTRRHPRMLLMEFLPNGTLEDVFEEAQMRNRPLSLELATKYAIETARGMAYLHHNSHRVVIHRDIKPGNLLLDKTGSIKVADFGLSKAVDESILAVHIQSQRNLANSLKDVSKDQWKIKRRQPFEQRGYQVGTYIYMPAELFRSKSDYTSKVDVYSYAMILYELYEGRQPFEEYATNPMYAAAAAAAGIRPEMNRTPKCIRSIIEQCWAEDPNQRPTFLEILKELEHVDGMIKYDKSLKSKVLVTIHFGINLLWFFLTCFAASMEYVSLRRTRREGLKLWIQGQEAGIVTDHSKCAFNDPILLSFITTVPAFIVLASLMFVVVPNKKIKAISRRGPKFGRRKGVCWKGLRKCCGGALEILRRITLISSVLSVCTVILQYEYEEYVLDEICNGDSSPFEPPKGVSSSLCEENYKHSHMAIIFQWILLALNIVQLIFHQWGVPEPNLNPKRFDLDYVVMRHQRESAASASDESNSSNLYDETSPLLKTKKTPISARQFYHIKHSASTEDFSNMQKNLIP